MPPFQNFAKFQPFSKKNKKITKWHTVLYLRFDNSDLQVPLFMWVPSERSSVPIISASWLHSFSEGGAIEDSTNAWLAESMSFLFQNNFQKGRATTF